MYASLVTVFACATAALAAPAPIPQADSGNGLSGYFGLSMELSDRNVSLRAILNGTGTDSNVVFYGVDDDGTGVYTNTTDQGVAIEFIFDNEIYAINVPDIGEAKGVAYPVTAEAFQPDFGFTIDQTVHHKLTAASQGWFACNRTVNGADRAVLAWGSSNNIGGSPAACLATTVYVTN